MRPITARHVLLALAVLLPPAPSRAAGPGGPPQAGHQLKLRDARIAELAAPLDGVGAAERARAATDALAAAFAAGERGAAVAARGDRAQLSLGARPVLLVGPDDAAVAGQPDAATLAGAIAARLDSAVAEEAFRLRTQGVVYAFSLLVFSALVAFLLARRAGAAALSTADRVEAGTLVVPGLSVGGIEVVSAGLVRGGVPLLLRLARFALQLVVFYLWLLFASSLFERTRPLGDRLTRAILDPAATFLGRLAEALPLAVVLAVAVAVLAIVLRAVRLHFDGLAAPGAAPGWLRPELARPTGLLVRLGIVVGALLAAPDLLGLESASGLRGLAFAALVAVGLGAAPLAGTIVLGVVAVYGGPLRAGDEAEVGGRRGKVLQVTLREIHLEEEGGTVVRVPHLLTLLHPTRVLAPRREGPR